MMTKGKTLCGVVLNRNKKIETGSWEKGGEACAARVPGLFGEPIGRKWSGNGTIYQWGRYVLKREGGDK